MAYDRARRDKMALKRIFHARKKEGTTKTDTVFAVKFRDQARGAANFRALNKIGPRTLRGGSRFWQKEEVIF